MDAPLTLDRLKTAIRQGAAVDVEANTVGGSEMSSWERGYGDLEMQPVTDWERRRGFERL